MLSQRPPAGRRVLGTLLLAIAAAALLSDPVGAAAPRLSVAAGHSASAQTAQPPGGDGAINSSSPGHVPPGNTVSPATSGVSQNSWPANSDSAAIGITPYHVDGSSTVLTMKAGDVATVLMYVANRFDDEVEPTIASQSGGYNFRVIAGSSTYSNHASGTAVDLNWIKHPQGSRGTFTSSQTATIHSIIAATNGVVRWGGDYTGTVDEMHFEIKVGPGDPALPILAAQLARGTSVASDRGVSSVVQGPDRVLLFASGADGELLRREFTPSTNVYTAWVEVAGSALGSAPAAATWADGTVQVFAKATTGTGLVRDIRHPSRGWLPEQAFGTDTPVQYAPAVVAPAQGQLRVFYVDTNGELYNKGYSNANWGPWGYLGGGFTSAPEVVMRNGYMHVYVAKGTGQLAKKTLNTATGTWTAWSYLTTPTMAAGSAPTAAVRSNGEISLAVRASDNTARKTTWNSSTGWTAFKTITNRGIQLGSSPELNAPNPTTLALFGRNPTGDPSSSTWTSGTGWTTWTPMS